MEEKKEELLENEAGTGQEESSVLDLSEADMEEFFSDAYRFKLDDFEGPLDLLLELIRKSKVSIEDVKISEITEQYLTYIKDMSQIDLDKASEFIAMAAWLLEIKSKAILPKPELEPEDEIDGERLLKQKLMEYKLYKEASLKMKETETVNILYRAPDQKFLEEPRFVLKDMNKDGLMQALKKMFLKLEQRAHSVQERQIQLDRFTVEDKIAHIQEVMQMREEVDFGDLFDSDYSKSEIITTFQAMLELLKMQVISARQEEVFGNIVIHRVEANGN